MKHLRIAMISEHASPLAALGGVDSGGQNVYVAQLAKHLARRGHSVDIFTRRDAPELETVVCWEPGVRIVHVPAGPATAVPKEELLPFMEQFSAFVMDFAVAEGGYDLAHANFWMSGLVATQLKRELGIPFVVTFHALGKVRRLHQGEDDGFPRQRNAIEEQIVAEADHVIAECPQDRADLVEHYRADGVSMSVVPCGVDPNEFTPEAKADARRVLGIDPDARLITHVGRMVPRKGIDTLIEALGLLRRGYGIDARMLIVGGNSEEPDPVQTPEIARLQSIAREQGVEDAVDFRGARPRNSLKHYYSAADVFATTPWYEPFGITPLEAMACGTPVIGADVGGIKYSVVDRETGYLVPPRDPDALAARLACLLTNPELATQFGARGRERVMNAFTWELVARQVLRVYHEVLQTRDREQTRTATEMAIVRGGFDDAIAVLDRARATLTEPLCRTAEALTGAFARGGKVLVCGNGGSAADAQHFAGELVGRYKQQGRPGLPVIALTADSAVMTAWANDVSFDDVFARQVEAFGQPGDVLIGISTSGKSKNVIAAFEKARAQGLVTVALGGRDGGPLNQYADLSLVVPSDDTQHIQETHAVLIHLLCELVERRLPQAKVNEQPRQNGQRSKNGHKPATAVTR